MNATASTPPGAGDSAAPNPERVQVEIACESWDQFERAFRRRLDSHQVFVPSAHPPPAGTQIEFRFSVPDGTSLRLPARVIASVPPATMRRDRASLHPDDLRPGMFVEFGSPARDVELGSPAVPSLAAESDMLLAPESDTLDVTRVLEQLQRELAALQRCDEFAVLGVARDADEGLVRDAYLQLSERFHPQRYARFMSKEITRVACELYVLVQRVYARVSDAAKASDTPSAESEAGRSPSPPQARADQPQALARISLVERPVSRKV